MNQPRHYDIVVKGSTAAAPEAGPSRGVETVVIVGGNGVTEIVGLLQRTTSSD